MDFDFTPEEEAFRAEVRAFLAEHLPPPEQRGPDFADAWLRAVRAKRYVGFAWPREVGGGGGGLVQQFILKDEMVQANAPLLGSDVTGLAWVGPAILQFIRPYLVDQADTPAFLSQVEQHTGTPFRDGTHGKFELRSAIATHAEQAVPCQAF